MKPIPPVDICKYFWIGEGVPDNAVTGIPIGATYINKTDGQHWVKVHGMWVRVLTLAVDTAGPLEADELGNVSITE